MFLDNSIDIDGINFIADALKVNQTLTSINLQRMNDLFLHFFLLNIKCRKSNW